MRWGLASLHDSSTSTAGAPRLQISKPTLCDAGSSGEIEKQHRPSRPSGGPSTSTFEPEFPPPPVPLRILKSGKLVGDSDINSNGQRDIPDTPVRQNPSQDPNSLQRSTDHKDCRLDPLSIPNGRTRRGFSLDSTRRQREGYSPSVYSARTPGFNNPRPDTDSSHNSVSLSKPDLARHSIMAIVGVVAVVALIVSSISLAKGQYLEQSKVRLATSDGPSMTATLWPSSPATGEGSDTTSIATITSHISDVATSTRITSSSKSSRSSSRTTSHSLTTDVNVKREILDRQQQSLVTGPNTACVPATTTASRAPTANETSQTSSVISSTQANVGGRRFNAPLAWSSLKKRWQITPYDQPVKSTVPSPTSTSRSELSENAESIVSSASSNAAVARPSLPWAASRSIRPTATPAPIGRRQQAGRQLSFWEAYSQLRQQAAVLCFATKTYLDPALTPSHVKNADDDSMAKVVNEKLCARIDTDFALVAQGIKCETKTEWESLEKTTEELCVEKMVGKIVMQSISLLCSTKNTLKSNIDDCGAGGVNSAQTPSTSSSSIPLTSPSGSALLSSVPTLATLSPPSAPTPSVPVSTPLSTPPPTACPPSVSQLTFSTPAPWSTPVLSSIPPWTASPSGFGLSNHGVLPTASLPCGYTNSTGAAPTIVPTVIVPATAQTGDITYYNNVDAFTNPPACGPNGTSRLQPHEAAVAISWAVFDLGKAEQEVWPENALCGRRIVAWCEADRNGTGTKARSEVTLWVRDRCTGCRPQDLDVLEDVFPFCSHVWAGRAPVSWRWAEDGVQGVRGRV